MWLAVTAAALAVAILEVAEAKSHIPAAAPAVAAVVGLGCAAVTLLALVSGRQDRCKA